MVMLKFTVNQNGKLLKVEKSKEKGLFESKEDLKYANKIKNKLNKKTKEQKWDILTIGISITTSLN